MSAVRGVAYLIVHYRVGSSKNLELRPRLGKHVHCRVGSLSPNVSLFSTPQEILLKSVASLAFRDLRHAPNAYKLGYSLTKVWRRMPESFFGLFS